MTVQRYYTGVDPKTGESRTGEKPGIYDHIYRSTEESTRKTEQSRVANRYADWFRQSKADLRHAETSLEAEQYEWCCFAAQQAAEKALKALFLKRGFDAWGHTLTALLGNLAEAGELPEKLFDCAKSLDKHYIPTRYPNGFDSGAPTDFYTKNESAAALDCAEKIIEYCKNQIQ